MELEDSSFPLLRELKGTTKLKEGFRGCEFALLLGGKRRKAGRMDRSKLISNCKIYKLLGESLNLHASQNVKVFITPIITIPIPSPHILIIF